jgi:RNA-directed DNA polymerase
MQHQAVLAESLRQYVEHAFGVLFPRERRAARRSRARRRHRHDSVEVQHRVLGQKLRGHYAYYDVTSNAVALKRLHFQVVYIWHKWLSRRSQRRMTWEKMLVERLPLPRPRIVHRYGT